MEKCPICYNDLILPQHAILNMENYHKPIKIKTGCCGRIIYANPFIKINTCEPELEHQTEDDWGEKQSTRKIIHKIMIENKPVKPSNISDPITYIAPGSKKQTLGVIHTYSNKYVFMFNCKTRTVQAVDPKYLKWG